MFSIVKHKIFLILKLSFSILMLIGKITSLGFFELPNIESTAEAKISDHRLENFLAVNSLIIQVALFQQT